jgi:DNA-binding MarR family transcriptional regulator
VGYTQQQIIEFYALAGQPIGYQILVYLRETGAVSLQEMATATGYMHYEVVEIIARLEQAKITALTQAGYYVIAPDYQALAGGLLVAD